MSIDELRGMEKAYKNIKHYCNQISRAGKDESVVTQTMNTILDSIKKYCDSSIAIVEESVDGEMQRMYEIMEEKKDDRQDHRDL